MLDLRKGFVVVGCVAVGFVVSAGPGLVASAAEPDRWVAAIATDARRSTADEGAAQRRVAELEQRVKELEAARSGAAKSGETSPELAAAMARSEALEQRNRTLSVENQELAQSRAVGRRSAACEAPDGEDPKVQLRYWATRMRDNESGFRGRVSSEWNGALNVLLKQERSLDPHNPWRQP
ncbi:MAG: hypothetical protein RL033_4161 [Pseudomonadota bacterium]|jgi:hypothetical protein